MRARRPLAVVLVAGLGAFAPAAAQATPPACDDSPTPRIVYSGQGLLESVIVGRAGRLYYSSTPSGQPGRIMKADHPGATPRVLSGGITGPGGMVFHRRKLIAGYGDTIANGTRGDDDPQSGLFEINPLTGRRTIFATGLGMANGVARAPDGTIFASNDFGRKLDRIAHGVVTHGWATVQSGNGMTVDRAGRFLYVAQTFVPSQISRVEIAHPANVTTFAAAGPADAASGLDGMTRDRDGNLYVAANSARQVWRVDRRGRICVLASGLTNPSAVAFGRGPRRFRGGNLYAVTFGGDVVELRRANRASFPG
jgi:sugar lactone lactonase YvrE